MSLQFTSLANQTTPFIKDDTYCHAPVVLADHQVNPLIEVLDRECTARTWRLATVGKEALVNGRRLENALWRLWAQQRLGVQRVRGIQIDWDSLTAWHHSTLLGPLVISKETPHSKAELFLSNAAPSLQTSLTLPSRAASPDLSPPHWEPGLLSSSPDQYSRRLSVDPRPCLKRASSRSSTTDSTCLSVSTRDSSVSPLGAPRHVAFNTCVVQCQIKDDSIIEEGAGVDRTENDRPNQVGFMFNGYEANDDEFNMDRPPSPTEQTPNLSRISTFTGKVFTRSMESLPPMKLRPLPSEEGDDSRVVFVPPRGMESLSESDLLPCRKRDYDDVPRGRTLQRRASSVNLTTTYDTAMEQRLSELKLPPAISIRKNPLSMDGEDCVMITRSGRRRRKASSSFVLKEEEADDWSQPHEEWVDIERAHVTQSLTSSLELVPASRMAHSQSAPDGLVVTGDGVEVEETTSRFGTVTRMMRSIVFRSWI